MHATLTVANCGMLRPRIPFFEWKEKCEMIHSLDIIFERREATNAFSRSSLATKQIVTLV